MAEPHLKAVELKGITKKFGSAAANDGIDFELEQGTIHALLGENGAGKSTLMNVLSGRYRPDDGEIWIRGERVRHRSPRDAIRLGIGMIHQHFMLVRSQTVVQNVVLGAHLPWLLRYQKRLEEISGICEQMGYAIDLQTPVWQLSMGEQQAVEIVKALYHGASILILDEPTAVLTPYESEKLFEVLKSMRGDGYSIIFVSHKLEQVLAIADKITILRQGRVAATLPNRGVDRNNLVNLMVGRPVERGARRSEGGIGGKSPGTTVLRMESVVARNSRGLVALKGINLTIGSGEILGIAGIAGNGQLELAEAVTGLRPVDSGQIWFGDRNITHCSVKERLTLGLAYVPEDRVGVGSVSSLGIRDNMLLRCYDEFSFFDTTEVDRYATELMEQYGVTYTNLSTPVKHLSGGNLQKMVLSRELRVLPKLLVAAYPIRGLDVTAIEHIHQILLKCRDDGTAILLISEELDELLAVSDRIAVLYGGNLIAMPTRDVRNIGLAMAGAYEQP